MSDILMLDVRTLAFVSSVGGFLLAAVMLGIYQAGMRERCLLDWFASGLATGGGFLVGHLFQTIEFPFPGWAVASTANAMIALGHGMLLVGVQRYLGHRCWTGTVILVSVALLASVFVFDELRESLRIRILYQSGWYAIVLTVAAVLLWKSRRPGMRSYHLLAAGIFAGYALFLCLRWFYALGGDALTTSFVQNAYQAATFLSAMLFGFFIAVALALVMFREKQVEVQSLAENDPLTGIKNRLTMDKVIALETARASRDRSALGLLLLDLDNFKKINDEHGHQAGDLALKQVAGVILAELRGDDVAFRYGGEEFLILLPATAGDDLLHVADRLRDRIAGRTIETPAGNFSLTASIGVTEFRYEQEDWEQCLQRVDGLMYQAKNAGRNRTERD